MCSAAEAAQRSPQVLKRRTAWTRYDLGDILRAMNFVSSRLSRYQALKGRGTSPEPGEAARGLPEVGVEDIRGEARARGARGPDLLVDPDIG